MILSKGRTKSVRRFALFPVRLDNRLLIWLEWYWKDKELLYDVGEVILSKWYYQTTRTYQKEQLPSIKWKKFKKWVRTIKWKYFTFQVGNPTFRIGNL